MGKAIAHARPFERLDDDHPAAVTWAAATRRRSGFGLAVGLGVRALGCSLESGERLAEALDFAGSDRGGEEAVVSDAVTAATTA